MAAAIEGVKAIDQSEAFRGQPAVIGNPLPNRDEKALAKRLDQLYEHFARSPPDVMAEARIKQAERMLDRYSARRLSLREWLAFSVTAAGLIIGAGGLAVAFLSLQ